MNKRTLLLRAPISTMSGYGRWSRQIISSILRSEQSKYLDLYIWDVNWGETPHTGLDEDTEENKQIKEIIAKGQCPNRPEIFLTCTIPNEFEKVGEKFTGGITAACETDRISPKWINQINSTCDMVYAISNWTAQMMRVTSYNEKLGNEAGPVMRIIKIDKPITIWSPCVDTSIYNPKVKCRLNLQFETTKNFLFVGHWLKGDYGKDRKNIGVLIRTFLQTFLGQTDVGLILKTSSAHFSLMDRTSIKKKIEMIKQTMIHNPQGLSLPKIYLIHGELSEKEMAQLYRHPSVIGYVSAHHGEGWGYPIAEAMACNVPALVVPWSGTVDFLKQDCFLPLKFEVKEIPDDCLWDDIFIKGARWANVDEQVLSQGMFWIYNNIPKAREFGVRGGEHIRNNFDTNMLDAVTNINLKYILDYVENRVDTSIFPFRRLKSENI